MPKRRSIPMALALLLSAALILPACSKKTDPGTTPTPTTTDPNTPRDGGTLTVGSFSEITTLNPLFQEDTASGDLSVFLFASLYDYNRNFDLEVNDRTLAAELPKISADGLTYTVKLKQGPKWSDGSPLTADDVVFTYQSLANKEVASPGYSSFEGVKEVKKVDETTVQVTLKDVDARFYYAANITPVPAKVFKDVKPADMASNPYGKDLTKTITSGPYVWKEWQEKQYHKLEKNPNYWGKKPHIQTVIFKGYADQNTEVQALLNGEIDFVQTAPVATLPAIQAKASDGIKVYESLGQSYDYLAFQFNEKGWPNGKNPFAGAKSRQAVGYAINQKGIIDSVLQGHGAAINGPFLPSSWANDAATAKGFPFDVNKAKQLLADDGWKAGSDGILEKDGMKFEFELMTNAGNKRRESISAVIQQNLKDVGIKVTLKPVDFPSIVDNYTKNGNFQALLLGWSLSSPDPDGESILSSKYFPPGGQNSGFYKNEQVDKLWVDGYRTADQAKRKDAYKKVLEQFQADPPYIFLDLQNQMTGYRDRVHWADADKPQHSISYGYFFHVHDWWVTD